MQASTTLSLPASNLRMFLEFCTRASTAPVVYNFVARVSIGMKKSVLIEE